VGRNSPGFPLQGDVDSGSFTKTDSQTLEFNVELPVHGEKELTYT
jgi:hypothetical protein